MRARILPVLAFAAALIGLAAPAQAARPTALGFAGLAFSPANVQGVFLDGWNPASGHGAGAAPTETTPAPYRVIDYAVDRVSGTHYAAVGTVGYTRPDEEPFGAVSTVEGRRGFLFLSGAYLDVPAASLDTPAVGFASASAGAPMRVLTAVRNIGSDKIQGSGLLTGDGTLWDRAGWRAALSNSGRTLTLTAPCVTSGSITAVFNYPQPDLGYARYWEEAAWNGSAWSFAIDGEAQAATSTTNTCSGGQASDAGADFTLGGRAGGNGVEHESDLLVLAMGPSRAAAIAQWREDTPVPMTWGRSNPATWGSTRAAALVDVGNLYYQTFIGSDGLGLKVKTIANKGDWWTAWGSVGGGVLYVITTSSVDQQTPSTAGAATGGQTEDRSSANSGSYKVFVNASGGAFAATGVENVLSFATCTPHPCTGSSADHIIVQGVGGGGPMGYFLQASARGTPWTIVGEDPSCSGHCNGATLSTTGTTANGGSTITSIAASLAGGPGGVQVGGYVSGTCIPANDTIAAFTSSSITLASPMTTGCGGAGSALSIELETPLGITNIVYKDDWSFGSTDNCWNFDRSGSTVFLVNPVCAAPGDITNHPESPGHTYGFVNGGGIQNLSFSGAVAVNGLQRYPTAFGSYGNSLVQHDLNIEAIGETIIPDAGSCTAGVTGCGSGNQRSFGGAAFGFANNNPGANNGSTHLEFRQLLFIAPRQLGFATFNDGIAALDFGAGGLNGAMPNDGDTVTVTGTGGSKTWTFKSSLAGCVNGWVHLTGTESTTVANFEHALQGSGGVSGTDYCAGDTADPSVIANSGTKLVGLFPFQPMAAVTLTFGGGNTGGLVGTSLIANSSTLHGVGDVMTNGSTLYQGSTGSCSPPSQADGAYCTLATYPHWGAGARLFPITQTGLEKTARGVMGRLPGFVQQRWNKSRAGYAYADNDFTVDPGTGATALSVGTNASPNWTNLSKLNATVNATVNDYCVACAAAGDAAFKDAARGGPLLDSQVDPSGTLHTYIQNTQKAPGAVLWPIIAPYLLQ